MKNDKLINPDFKIICAYTNEILEQDIPQIDLQNAISRAIETQKKRERNKDRSNFKIHLM